MQRNNRKDNNMQNYAIHRKPNDGTVYVINGIVEGYNILTLVDEVDANTPLDAAKVYLGEQRGKKLVIDDVESLGDNINRISYHWMM